MARSRRAAELEIPPRDWWVAALSVIGVLVAGYLAVNKWSGGTALFCTAGSGCDIVQASRYALFLGLPTAAWGAGLYAAVGALALLGLPPRRWLAAFLLAVAGASFSLYLTYLSIFAVGATCTYCLASLAIALALFGTLLVRRPHPTGRRSPVRLARVAALGSATALATVILGAAVFATLEPKEAAPYQEALARHLKASGAVMYGAYW
jgi:uncharacterized membrane protein